MKLKRRGLGLIEILMYVATVAIVLTAALTMTVQIFRARAKTSTILEVEQNAHFALEKMGSATRSAITATVPANGATGAVLTITLADSSISPTTFQVTNGVLTMQQGAGAAVPLTTSAVQVTGLSFQNLLDPSYSVPTGVVVACPPQANKVLLCHNPFPGSTTCVNSTAVNGHLGHGDFLGPCQSPTSARGSIRITFTVASSQTTVGNEYQSSLTLYDTATIRRQN